MNILTPGPVGQIHSILEAPSSEPLGVALISHPQPLLGGTPKHIVPHSIAKAVADAGWVAVRPSFRGVGETAGEYSEGIGETEDAAAVVAHVRSIYPGLPVALIGFSFGAYVYARLAQELEQSAPADAIVLLGLPVGTVPGGRNYDAMTVPSRALLMHGEHDTMAPLGHVLDWARGRMQPILVYPGADHFFKGCLRSAIEQVVQRLRSVQT